MLARAIQLVTNWESVVNLEKLENVLHAFVAFVFGVGLLVALAPPAKADAAEVWVAYRVANGLPVDPEPTPPGELPVGGPVPDAATATLPVAANGNGEEVEAEGEAREDPFLVELARTDG